MLPNGSSDNEKARAINSILNDEFFSKIDERPVYIRQYYSKGRGASISFDAEKLDHLYKFCPVFKDELEPKTLYSYSDFHSMISTLILDLPLVKNEDKLVTNLRENYKKILKFSKQKDKDELIIENCDIRYQKKYANMLRHILLSDKKLPKNIDYNSIEILKDRKTTYTIRKK